MSAFDEICYYLHEAEAEAKVQVTIAKYSTSASDFDPIPRMVLLLLHSECANK